MLKPVALLFLATLTLPAWAKLDSSSCLTDLGDAAPASVAYTLTADEASAIVGQSPIGEAGPLVGRALKQVRSMKSATFAQRILALGTLFEAVRRAQFFSWDYQRFEAPDGRVGFYGDQGPFVLLSADGRIFKGRLDPETSVRADGRWNGQYEEMREILSE